MSPAAAREPERVLAVAGRVDVRVEVVGHRSDVLVAHIIMMRVESVIAHNPHKSRG